MPSSRSRRKPSPSHTFDAIGTRWQVDTDDPLMPALVDAIAERCGRFDRVWSRFRDDSLVRRIATTPGTYVLPDEAGALFELYRALYDCTDGAMSPLVGRALEQWGYDSEYSLRHSGAVHPVPTWDEAFAWDGTALTTLRPVVLDIGAAGKGYLVDLLGEMLSAAGLESFSIDASGDILHRGGRPLRIALEHPLDSSRAIGVAALGDGALCASASNRRSWPGAHHIIDAITGRPTDSVIATWAIAADGLTADGLATALFFAAPTRLAERFDFQYVRMFRSGTVETSARFDGEVFA